MSKDDKRIRVHTVIEEIVSQKFIEGGISHAVFATYVEEVSWIKDSPVSFISCFEYINETNRRNCVKSLLQIS